MNFTQADIPHIKWSLTVFLAVIIAGGGAVMLADNHASNAKKSRQMLEQQVREARNKLNTARDDLQNMATYQKEYTAIQQRGIIGNEERLGLIEDLNNLRRRNLVLNFKYSISPQQTYKPLITLDTGNFNLNFSPMTVHFELLHEGQFMRFFDSMRHDINGWFILNKCSLEKSPGAVAQLKAECHGGWLTLKNRNTP